MFIWRSGLHHQSVQKNLQTDRAEHVSAIEPGARINDVEEERDLMISAKEIVEL